MQFCKWLRDGVQAGCDWHGDRAAQFHRIAGGRCISRGRVGPRPSGTLYGTTYFGGASNLGTVFKLDNAGVETVLYSVTGGATDGAYPLAGLLQGATGTLYGTTNLGGASNLGTVFRVTSSGTETMLRSLRGGSDGRNPRAGLVQDPAGNLYGTTSAGGPHNKGTVFKLSR
jgi:uncharacterized repeat protein (TIGR03803 family)